MRPNPHGTADLVIFTAEILIGKLHFLCSKLCSCKLGSCKDLNEQCDATWGYFEII